MARIGCRGLSGDATGTQVPQGGGAGETSAEPVAERLTIFAIRSGRYPLQDIQVASNLLDILNGLSAASVAIAGLAVPGFLTEQGQSFSDVEPTIRIPTLTLSQYAGVLQVTDSRCCRPPMREPRAVWVRNSVRDLVQHHFQVFRTATNALSRIFPVCPIRVAAAVAEVSIMMPLTPVGETADASQCDS